MTRTTFIAAALALAVTLPAMPAQAAGAPRTFVSAAGSDSNNCTNVATPCRHLAAAFAATAADGEIYVLDPANYGSLTITHGVSIEGHGWASIAPVTGQAAITINANSGDAINIIGVVLDGTALANTNGIVFNSGGSLTVADSVVRNFGSSGQTTGNGILLAPASGPVSFVITNTIVSNNGFAGISYQPPSGSATTNGVIDHVVATNNQEGILIDAHNQGGGGSIKAAISNSVASNNSDAGIEVTTNAAALAVSIDSTGVSGNFFGIAALNTVNVLLSRSVIQGNGTGILNNTSPNTFYTYGNNLIDLNASNNISSPLNATVTLR
jgi:hypothetical protein